MSRAKILIVDDDPSVTASLELLLGQHGYEPVVTHSADACVAAASGRCFDLVLQDMNLSRGTSGKEGLDLLDRLRSTYPAMPVILITAWGSIELAVSGIKAGAADFITKPWSNHRLLQAVETAIRLSASGGGEQPAPSREELDASLDLRHLIGRDPCFISVLDTLARVAATDASVLITGDSGTGKELIAEALHRNSGRADGPFVKVNLGGISSTLFASEMFGHVKGAFTDASHCRSGRFAVADGGTIFLDEVGDVDANAQVKLLRVLQDRTYEPVGSSTSTTVDVRVLSATNRDLVRMVESGAFREDLYYRLNLITLKLPPLRDRRQDIPLLASHFLELSAAAYGRQGMTISEKAMAWLARQPWPGNIRQLKQTIERAVLMGRSDLLELADLSDLTETASPSPHARSLPEPGSMTLQEMERAMISRCLEHYEHNLTRAAQALGLSRAALYRKLARHGLDRSQE